MVRNSFSYLILREPNAITEKNKDAVRERDNLYKKNKRLSMKFNDPAKNAERLKKQRLAKAEYRKRKREESKNTEIQPLPPSSSSAESSSQSSSQSTISSPRSWHRSAKSRSLWKAIRALPRSPREKIDIVKSLASNFNFRI